jgi:hypothetical protein
MAMILGGGPGTGSSRTFDALASVFDLTRLSELGKRGMKVQRFAGGNSRSHLQG